MPSRIELAPFTALAPALVLGTYSGSNAAFYVVSRDGATANRPQLQVVQTTTSTPAPNPPTGLQRVSPPDDGLSIAWSDASSNETGFEIERKVAAGSWTLIHTNNANDIEFTDAGYVATSDHSYRVRAINGSTLSTYSNEIVVPARSNAPTVSALSTTSLTLTWNDASSVESGVRVERQVVGGSWSTLTVLAANTTTHTDNTVADGTVYEYRIRATTLSANGLPSGATQAVVPLKAPTGLATTSVQSTSSTAVSVALSWTDVSANNTHYEVQRQLAGGSWSTLTSGVTGYIYTDTTAEPEKTYEYRVRAINGTPAASSGFATLTGVITPPAAPTSLQVATTTPSTVSLVWTDNATTESEYRVERRLTGTLDYETIDTLPAGTTSYTDNDPTLEPDTSYDYRVRAHGSAGDSVPSNSVTATTSTFSAAPSDIFVAHASFNYAYLLWQDNSSDETGFVIEASTSPAFGTLAATESHASDSVEGFIDGLQPNTLYYFRVKATRSSLQSHTSDSASATTAVAPPTAATGISAVAVSDAEIQVSWSGATGTVSDYIVYRREGGEGEFEVVSIVESGTSFLDEALTDGTSYSYYVVAQNVSGKSAASPTASAVTTLLTPLAPGGLYTTDITSESVDIAWGDYSHSETGFVIERKEADGGSWETLETIGSNIAEYVDSSVEEGIDYLYRIKAGNLAGWSDYSEELSVTTPPTAPEAPSALSAEPSSGGSAVDLAWTDESNNEDSFIIERSDNGTDFSQIDVLPEDVTSYSDSNVTAGVKYWYRVLTSNVTARSSPSNTGEVVSSLGTPGNLTPTVANSTEVNLTWTDTNTTETGFSIEMAVGDGPWAAAQNAPVNATGWTITGLSPHAAYRFRIKAVNLVSESNYAESSSVTPSGGVTATWSNGAGPFYGPAQGTELQLSGLTVGQQYTVSFNFNAIASWDGNQADYIPWGATDIGPDYWTLKRDGQTLVNDTFTNWADIGFTQSYPGTGGSGAGTSVYPMSFTFTAGSTATTFSMAGDINLSALPEEDESWTITNLAFDDKPSVSITAIDGSANEPPNAPGNDGKATFRISRTGATTSALTVQLQPLAGTAINGTDYGTVDTAVTIPANSSYADVSITPAADWTTEGTESVTIALKAGLDYRILTATSSTSVAIADGPLVNLEIDSDNNGVIAPSDDPIEAEAGKPGKIIQVNDDDTDGDRVPDFADFDVPDSNPNGLTQRFVPLSLVLPANLPPHAAITFTYDASDPADVVRSGTGTLDDPYIYTPGDGRFRIWTGDGNTSRNSDSVAVSGGHYVPSSVPLAVSQLGGLSLYVEAVSMDAMADIGSEKIFASVTLSGGLTVDGLDVIVLTPVALNLAVDQDRDGKISYQSRDFPSKLKPFSFWLNDDNDVAIVDEEVSGERATWIDATDIKSTSLRGDAADALIGKARTTSEAVELALTVFQRDLEDFSAASLRYPTVFENSDLVNSVELSWVAPTGSLRLWRGYFGNPASPSAIAHVEDSQTIDAIRLRTTVVSGNNQKPKQNSSLLLEANEPIRLSLKQYRDLFANADLASVQNGYKTVPLLFEAQSAGSGELRVRFLDTAKPTNITVGDSRIQMSLKSSKEFYEWHTIGDHPRNGDLSGDPLLQPVPTTSLFSAGENARSMSLSDDYLLLVHGWRMSQFDKRMFAETTFKRLYWSGYRGTVGTFSWPTLYTEHPELDPSNFNRSEEVAWHSAAGLRWTLQQIDGRYSGKLTMLAHSQGNIVASEALYLSRGTKLVDTYIASNSAVSAHFYNGSAASELSPGVDTDYWIGAMSSGPASAAQYKNVADAGGTTPRFSSPTLNGAAGKMINYYKADDYATESLWELNNSGRSRKSPLNISRGFGALEYDRIGDPSTTAVPQLYAYVQGNPFSIRMLTEQNNRYAVYAHLFASLSKSLGATNMGAGAWGPFQGGFDLGPAGLDLGSAANGHSRQFFSSYRTVSAYWRRAVLDAK